MSPEFLTPATAQATAKRVPKAGVKKPLPLPQDVPHLPALLTPKEREDRAQEIQKQLNDPRITVRIFQDAKNHDVVAQLVGGLPSPREVEAAEQVVDLFIPTFINRKISGLYLDTAVPSLSKALSPPPQDVPLVTNIWPLTFGTDEIESGAGAAVTAGRYDISTLVTALNTAYKKQPADPDIVKEARHTLIIRAPEATAYMIRHDLAMLDAPAPQVQLDVYALQVSGHEEQVTAQMTAMKKRISNAQRIMRSAPEYLSAALRDHKHAVILQELLAKQVLPKDYPFKPLPETVSLDDLRSNVIAQLLAADFNLETRRKLSLNEAYIILAVLPSDEQKSVMHDWSKLIQDALQEGANSPEGVVTPQQWKAMTHRSVKVNGQSLPWYPLWRTEHTLVASDQDFEMTVLRGISEFMRSMALYWRLGTYEDVQRQSIILGPKTTALYSATMPQGNWGGSNQNELVKQSTLEQLTLDRADPGKLDAAKADEEQRAAQKLRLLSLSRNPEQLARYTTVVDGFFDVISTAFSADLQDAILDPLMENLRQQGVNAQGSKGVSLVGRTRLVVTSGLESSLTPTMTGSVDTTIPKPLVTDDLLGNLLRREPASGAAREGAEGVFGGLTQVQAVLLGAALAKPVTPVYNTVSPGVGILVRPTVMANAASARLQIKAYFGVESTGPDMTGHTDVFQPAPVNTVKKHEVTTDAIIGALDLFEISSFDIDTRHPRGPGYVPVLGRLPLIGKAFQWRRKDTQLEHNSVILVNAIILPRALDLTRFYASP